MCVEVEEMFNDEGKAWTTGNGPFLHCWKMVQGSLRILAPY
jgi:hypothetical protein